MITEIRYFKIPGPLIEEQKINPLTSGLYFTEIGEIEVERGTIWSLAEKLENNLLVYCARGSGIVMIAGEQISVSKEQFSLFPKAMDLSSIR